MVCAHSFAMMSEDITVFSVVHQGRRGISPLPSQVEGSGAMCTSPSMVHFGACSYSWCTHFALAGYLLPQRYFVIDFSAGQLCLKDRLCRALPALTSVPVEQHMMGRPQLMDGLRVSPLPLS